MHDDNDRHHVRMQHIGSLVHTKEKGGLTPERMKPGILLVFIIHYYIDFINDFIYYSGHSHQIYL